MPDFNKGDFTQQGVAGDVTALVRLNEKRTVKLTLSSDDASDNCDISGSVIDELNDKTYPIGAGVSGNIEITENGENINVAPYATATVNVSGGGGSLTYYTCQLTNVFPEGVTIDDFSSLNVYNYLELEPDFMQLTYDEKFGSWIMLYTTPVIFVGIGNALLTDPVGETNNSVIYGGVITGTNVIAHEPVTPFGNTYYEITGDGAITITWTLRT